jgi:hypothetical protein
MPAVTNFKELKLEIEKLQMKNDIVNIENDVFTGSINVHLTRKQKESRKLESL